MIVCPPKEDGSRILEDSLPFVGRQNILSKSHISGGISKRPDDSQGLNVQDEAEKCEEGDVTVGVNEEKDEDIILDDKLDTPELLLQPGVSPSLSDKSPDKFCASSDSSEPPNSPSSSLRTSIDGPSQRPQRIKKWNSKYDSSTYDLDQLIIPMQLAVEKVSLAGGLTV